MADEPDNMVLRYLRRIDQKVDNLTERVDDLTAEMRSVRLHMAGSAQDHLRHDTNDASLRARVERIERRLDLQETAE